MRPRSWLGLATFGAITAGAALFGSIATRKRVRGAWYTIALRKPPWQPPRAAFGPVWTSLYALIAASGWRVWEAPPSPSRSRALALWAGQLAMNAAWPWLFFGARSPRLGLAGMGVLLPAIGAYANEARRVDPGAAWMVAPYLGWSTFAAALNAEIVHRNW